jgi:hypothetical protein
MRPEAGGHGPVAGAAEALLAVVAVHQAIVGAKIALIQDIIGRGDFLVQQAPEMGL